MQKSIEVLKMEIERLLECEKRDRKEALSARSQIDRERSELEVHRKNVEERSRMYGKIADEKDECTERILDLIKEHEKTIKLLQSLK